MKKQKASNSRPRNAVRESPELNAPLRAPRHSLREAVERVLDAAALVAQPYPEEAEAVDRVHQWVRHGRIAHVRVADVVLVLSIVLSAIERDLTPDEHEALALVDAAIRGVGRVGTPPLPPQWGNPTAAQSIAQLLRFAA